MLIYKSLNSLVPDYSGKLLVKCSDDREWLLPSSDTDARMPLLKRMNDQKVFSFRGAKLWISIDRESNKHPP